MKAAVYDRYGSPDVLRIEEVTIPTPKADEVLVRNHASSVNFVDHASVGGKPYLLRVINMAFFRPKHRILGGDVAGVVESVGSSVTRFKPGDEVYGDNGDFGLGAFAEYVAASEKALAIKPSNLSFQECASIPQSSVVALQGLRDTGGLQSGQKVLINGASGGIGTFAVQIAKVLGAEVTAVCSSDNLELVRELGADHVIDYKQEDFTKSGIEYNLIFDVPVKHSISDVYRALKPNGKYLAIGFNWNQLLSNPSPSKNAGKTKDILNHKTSYHDLEYMRGLVEAGKVVPVIDNVYKLSEVSEAITRYSKRHSRGKIIVSIA